MSLTAAGIQRFRSALDAVLLDCHPCLLTIGETSVTAAGPGGAEVGRMLDGGEDFLNTIFHFRLPATAPDVQLGQSITWTVGERSIPLEITAIELRPSDPSIPIRCRVARA
jgi:hypothetical protein